MDLNKRYNSKENWIGATEGQKKWTKYLYQRLSGLNYTSFSHDQHYTLMLREDWIPMRFILKVVYDIIFLIMGVLRSIKTLQVEGIIVTALFYIVLLVSTPFYKGIWKKG